MPECRVIEELRLLLDISYTLESSLELRAVIRPMLSKLKDVAGLRRGAITILNRSNGGVSISEAIGLPKDVDNENYLTACREVIDQVIETGTAVVVPDISKEPALRERWREESVRPDAEQTMLAYLCVPIRFGTEVVGILSAERLGEPVANLSADRRRSFWIPAYPRINSTIPIRHVVC